MKKFFDRLRCWLIKKLGGYTEQFTPIPHRRMEVIPVMEMKPQMLQATTSVEPMPGREHDLERYCKDQLTQILVQKLQESGFILWQRQDDMFEQEVKVRAVLYAVNANDLRERFPSWEG